MIRLRDPFNGAEAQWDVPDAPRPPLDKWWAGDEAFIRDVILRFVNPFATSWPALQDCIRHEAQQLGLKVVRETPVPMGGWVDDVPFP